jgi:hypothetical protein
VNEWVELADREYLSDFILAGGGSVRFLAGSPGELEEVSSELDAVTEPHDFVRVDLDAAQTRLHRIDHVFFEVARQIDWAALAKTFVAEGFRAVGWHAETTEAGFDLELIAAQNGVEVAEVRVALRKWLQALYEDYAMSQEFRLGILQLCRAQIVNLDNAAVPVVFWLRGELPRISELKSAKIFQKIGRHNARLMLESLTHWLHRNGRPGLVITLDITRCIENPRRTERREGFYYSAGALTEVYEMLRQLIDSSASLIGTFVAVFAPPSFLSDERRGVDRYQALKMRIFDDVRTLGAQNLLAPLIRLDALRLDAIGSDGAMPVEGAG